MVLETVRKSIVTGLFRKSDIKKEDPIDVPRKVKVITLENTIYRMEDNRGKQYITKDQFHQNIGYYLRPSYDYGRFLKLRGIAVYLGYIDNINIIFSMMREEDINKLKRMLREFN